jgi:cytochrome c biogenesis protein CcmG, thiol:disulfide interchange protein DsbE
MRRLVYLLPVMLLAVLAAFFFRGLGLNPRDIPSVLIDRPVPEMALAALPGRGDTGLSTANLKGQVSLVNIYGSWCIACVQEHPTLKVIQKTAIIPIHGIDWRDDPIKGAEWLKKNGDPYTRVGADPAPGHTAVDFGVTGAPESFLVDKAGIIRLKYVGPITPDVWQRLLLPKIVELQKQ